jgi:hypothetical protein
MSNHEHTSHLMYLNALGGVELFQHCQIPSATDTDLLSIIWGSKGFLRSVPLYTMLIGEGLLSIMSRERGTLLVGLHAGRDLHRC